MSGKRLYYLILDPSLYALHVKMVWQNVSDRKRVKVHYYSIVKKKVNYVSYTANSFKVDIKTSSYCENYRKDTDVYGNSR